MKLTQTKFAAVAIVLGLAAMCSLPLWAQSAPSNSVQTLSNSVANDPVTADVSVALRDMGPQAAVAASRIHRPLPTKAQPSGTVTAASLAQAAPGTLISAGVGVSVQGVGNVGSLNCPAVSGQAVAPPDTTLAVGDTQVVQWVNTCFAIFNKATGALIAGPYAGNRFWQSMKSTCATANDGDIIISFDKNNHVWVATQNVFGPYLTCIAVSQTADATGAYNRYAFTQPGFPDYPKWGLTPTLYYQTVNDFGLGGNGFVGVNVCAYDAIGMIKGRKNAKQVCVLDNSAGTLFDDSLVPADDDFVGGSGAAPEVFLGSIDNPGHNSAVYMVTMTVNTKKFTATLSGTNGTSPIAVPAFTLACGGFGACVPQGGAGSELLDSLGDRLMYRVSHQKIGANESWVVTHSVNNTTGTAARWYQFTAPAGSTSLALAQSGETPDDGEYRWMGSAAMDKVGNIAVGYSRSSSAENPSIYYAGHESGDPAGVTAAENLILTGGGSQSNTVSRWGDYSTMALDGSDGCTLWYTTEYYPADGSFAWSTWLASLKFPNCQ